MPANEANPIYPSERERCDLEVLVCQPTCAQKDAVGFYATPRQTFLNYYFCSAVLVRVLMWWQQFVHVYAKRS